MPGSPAKAPGSRTNTPSSSPHKRKHVDGVGAEARGQRLAPKTPKVPDETKEAEARVHFGIVGEIDTVAEEKGADGAGDSADHHMSARSRQEQDEGHGRDADGRRSAGGKESATALA